MKQTKLLFFLLFLLSLSLTSAITIDYNSPTPSNGSTISSRNFIINATINTDNPLNSIIYNWNNTNNTLIDSSLQGYCNFNNQSSLGENNTLINCWNGLGGFNGTLSGFGNYSINSSGKYGYGIIFTGNVAKINITNNFWGSSSSNFSIMGWFKTNSSSQQTIYSEGNKSDTNPNFLIRANVNGVVGSFGLSIRNNTVNNTDLVTTVNNDGLWHHFATIKNSSGLYLFIDGSLRASNTTTIIGIVTTDAKALGVYDRGSPTLYWNGTIDEFSIHNRSLNSNEIYNYYLSTINKFNSTNYIFTNNQSNVNLTINYKYSVYVNDSLSNYNYTERNIRFLNIINLTFNYLWNINSYFYQVGDLQWISNATNRNQIDADNDGSLDTYSNYTWHREKLLDARINGGRVDLNIESRYSNKTGGDGVNFTGDFNKTFETIRYAYLNNQKVVVIISYMPTLLADNSSGNCNDLKYCSANNWTKWNNIVTHAVNNITNGGQFNNVLFEVWNEPDYGSFWFGKLSNDNISKYTNYSALYNNTRTTIKIINNSYQVGGYAATSIIEYPNFLNSFLGNWSQQIDFFSLHIYGNDIAYKLTNNTNFLRTRCLVYNANCSLILWDEWNNNNASITNYSYLGYTSSVSDSYTSLHNINTSNIWSFPFKWSNSYWYGQYSNNYPNRYAMVDEPKIGNFLSSMYNVTYNFARYAPATGSVYTSTSEYSPYKIVATTIGNTQNLIVTNIENDKGNVTINCEGNYRTNYIDISSGQLYDCSSGSVNIGVFNEYDVRYLTEFTNVFYNSDWYFGNYLDEPIRLMTAEEIAQYLTGQDLQEGTCIDMIQIVGGWIPLIGLIGTVVFLGAIMLVLGGFAMFKAPNIDSQSIVGGIVVVIFTGLLVIVSIVIFSNLCF